MRRRRHRIGESPEGGPDLAELAAALQAPDGTLVICALSAASNVTGIVADVPAITRLVKQSGAKMLWDYAGGAPYLSIQMSPAADAQIDAIVFSPHKFIGGPGASGVLIVRRDAVTETTPAWPGGGTVKFVSPAGHDYSGSLESREEAGTPNVVGDIRAALVLLVKEALGADFMRQRNAHFVRRALGAWKDAAQLELLGSLTANRLPVFSFRVRNGRGGFVHQQLVTRMLSDRFGIQARGGCACAGPMSIACWTSAKSSRCSCGRPFLTAAKSKARIRPIEFQRAAVGRQGRFHPGVGAGTGLGRGRFRRPVRLRSQPRHLLSENAAVAAAA